MPATRRARAAAAEREVKRRAAHEVSVERTRLVGKLDVGVLSVIAGFGGKRELWGVALAFKEHGVEILASEPTLDAILLASRGDTVLRKRDALGAREGRGARRGAQLPRRRPLGARERLHALRVRRARDGEQLRHGRVRHRLVIPHATDVPPPSS